MLKWTQFIYNDKRNLHNVTNDENFIEKFTNIDYENDFDSVAHFELFFLYNLLIRNNKNDTNLMEIESII